MYSGTPLLVDTLKAWLSVLNKRGVFISSIKLGQIICTFHLLVQWNPSVGKGLVKCPL